MKPRWGGIAGHSQRGSPARRIGYVVKRKTTVEDAETGRKLIAKMGEDMKRVRLDNLKRSGSGSVDSVPLADEAIEQTGTASDITDIPSDFLKCVMDNLAAKIERDNSSTNSGTTKQHI